MSLEKDITQIKEDMFKKASPKELKIRREKYKETPEGQREREDLRYETEERVFDELDQKINELISEFESDGMVEEDINIAVKGAVSSLASGFGLRVIRRR
jgi:hypothetical protein